MVRGGGVTTCKRKLLIGRIIQIRRHRQTMPNPPDKLADLTRAAIAALPGDPGSAAWQKAFEKVIAKAHTAAYYAGLAEKSAGGKARAWLAKFVGNAALSKEQRAELKGTIKAQLDYMKAFAAEAGEMSEAAVANRAGMYAGSVRGTYYGARHPGLSQYPGDGNTKCLSNCKCFLTEQDDGIHWELSAVENCQDCIDMAAGSPY